MSPPAGGRERLKQPMSSVSGLNLLARIIWYRSKARINRILLHQVANAPPVERPNTLPHEIVEMIIAYLIQDVRTLKVCSLACYSWYIAALPHIHHTLTFNDANDCLKSLSNRHALGLLPFTKEIRIPQLHPFWFVPKFFSQRNSCHFFAFTNIQSLTVHYLYITVFIPKLTWYFGHLSPTLRSLTLFTPYCTPLELAHFISSFPNLEDIAVRHHTDARETHKEALASLSTPKLHGKLVLLGFDAIGAWEHLATSCGLRFRFIHVGGVIKSVPILLTACARTLETFRIELLPYRGWHYQTLVQDHDLSQLKVLRSFQIEAPTDFLVLADFPPAVESIFRTVKSPVFSELEFIISFREASVTSFPEGFFEALRRMYRVRPFKLGFLFIVSREGSEDWGGRWAGMVNAAVNEGPLSCLESPPSIGFSRNAVC